MQDMKPAKPQKPTPDFPLFPHASGRWAKKIKGQTKYFGPWADPEGALARYHGSTEEKIASSERKAKPSATFPLFLHASGQWAKKVRQKLEYFGTDKDAALARWNAEKDDLLAGRKPATAPVSDAGLTIKQLCNKFLNSKRRQLESGELDGKTFAGYEAICEKIIGRDKADGKDKVVGILQGDQLVVDLKPIDFEHLRSKLAKGVNDKVLSPVTVGNFVNRARVLFNYAFDNDLIDRPVKYGKAFSKPKKSVLRKEKSKRHKRLFSAVEVKTIIDAASPAMKAMIYLGVNAGLGNQDCAKLERSQLDLEGGWLDYPRPKTGIDRRCRLWPETVAAIKAALAVRPKAKDAAHENHVFITRTGQTWGPKTDKGDSPISNEMAKLLKTLGLQRQGVNFYALRHTFQTIAEKSLDKDAVRYVMGHVEAAGDMSATYSEEKPSDKRLTRIAKRVRRWLIKGSKQLRQTAEEAVGGVGQAQEAA